jgi:hypothetical protein
MSSRAPIRPRRSSTAFAKIIIHYPSRDEELETCAGMATPAMPRLEAPPAAAGAPFARLVAR